MQSTLFTELTAIEEANLSGGGKNVIKIKQVVKNKGRVDIDVDDDFDNSGYISSDATGTITATIND
ncbi:MAG: hypothetical protein RMY64_23930 [Nostoc sp. DedQUE08]|uniref:hypothetical protein n=1 Tax=Nostoc sp. DedQUE08 TaxID=3075393 RepID=UPI002AD2F65E|nr:hypothetical protein [Nostoc sp. DedQUE08]MDZ8068643.1 hypothetical protein [Nostoc sp. DedQUE08]